MTRRCVCGLFTTGERASSREQERVDCVARQCKHVLYDQVTRFIIGYLGRLLISKISFQKQKKGTVRIPGGERPRRKNWGALSSLRAATTTREESRNTDERIL
jgi:hypothetical protein